MFFTQLPVLIDIIDILRNMAWYIYFGIVVATAVLCVFSSDKRKIIEIFQQFGVILGLSFGSSVLFSILLRWMEVGHFYPSYSHDTMVFVVGGMLWLSNMILEIWTLDPIRKSQLHLLHDGAIIARAQSSTQFHIVLQALLCICLVVIHQWNW